ncbi:3730_t:CDS:2, partial [Racocetra fulgida]
KTKLYLSVVRQQDSSSATINNYNNNSNKRIREITPPVKQAFSFTASKQGVIVEPLLNLVEKAIYKFFVENENCKEASSNKENIDNEVVQRWINKADKEYSHLPQKRKLDDTNLGKITKFVLNILEETKEIEKGDKQKILRLALNEDEYLIKLWRAIHMEENQ